MHTHLFLSASIAKGLFWAAVVICGLANLAIVRSVMRSAPRRRREVVWAIIPALLLVAVFVVTWRHLSAGA
jgi:hypothetical protein